MRVLLVDAYSPTDQLSDKFVELRKLLHQVQTKAQ